MKVPEMTKPLDWGFFFFRVCFFHLIGNHLSIDQLLVCVVMVSELNLDLLGSLQLDFDSLWLV